MAALVVCLLALFVSVSYYGRSAKAQVVIPPDPAPDPSGPPNIFYGSVPPEGVKAPVIVFVHGLKGIAADWWVNRIDGSPNPMYGLAYAQGYRTAFVNLSPNNLPDANATWQQNAITLKSQLTTIAAHYGVASFYLVGHSMGGLSAEAALLNPTWTALDPQIAPLVKAVFTLSTPNHGTPLADWAFGPGQLIASLFGLTTPAVQSLEVNTVNAFRAAADPLLAQSNIQFYTYAGFSFFSKDIILIGSGVVLLGLTPGPNDGLVPASSVLLPYAYAMDIGGAPVNHFQMIEGNFSFPIINHPIQGLERQIPGFKKIATGGFGDDDNSFAWSMKWFKGKLYVGTGRQVRCLTGLASDVQQGTNLYHGSSVCPADPKDLRLAAEIWQYTPPTKTWVRVYKSPEDIPIGNDASGHPVMTARDIGYRGMTVFTESDGTQALYVGSVTSGEVFGNIQPYTFKTYPPPRILRSTDGVNWAPLPQNPGTFLGDITSNTPAQFNVFGIRSLTSFKGKLFATAGPFTGEGYVIASANPSAGNDTWFAASPFYDRFPVWDLQVFNSRLYAVGGLEFPDYFVSWTDAQGAPPYTFNPVITQGANAIPGVGSDLALSTAVFNNQLYVGTDGPQPFGGNLSVGSEMVRVYPDDTTWDLVVGQPRLSLQGEKSPVTGIGQYFDNQFNRHFWRMGVYTGGAHQGLYMGTYDYSVELVTFSVLGTLALSDWGTDFYTTNDGVHWKVVTATGFGDGNNYGIRAIENTPFGLFVGTARFSGGTQIWLDQTVLDYNNDGVIDQSDVNVIQAALNQPASGPNDPRDLDQDGKITVNDAQLLMTQCTNAGCAPPSTPVPQKPPAPANLTAAPSDSVSLSWDPVPAAARYRVYRHTDVPILQGFPPGGIILRFFGIPIRIPSDILAGRLNFLCPPGGALNNSLCAAVYLLEASALPGSPIGYENSVDYLGATTGTSFQQPAPYPLQSLYWVRAEDAEGNLSEPSNVAGAPQVKTNSGQSLIITPSSLTFSSHIGDPAPQPQNVLVSSVGSPTGFTAVTSKTAPWLHVFPTSGTAPSDPQTTTLVVTANPGGLSPGTYVGQITITDQTGNAQQVNVQFNITGNAPPGLLVSPASLTFTYQIGEVTDTCNPCFPPDQVVLISKSGPGAPPHFSITLAAGLWLQVNQVSGFNLSALFVGVDPVGMDPGTYQGFIVITEDSGATHTIYVTLKVLAPQGSLQVTPQALTFNCQAGGPAPQPQQFLVSTSGGFTVSASTSGNGNWLQLPDPSTLNVPSMFVPVSIDPTGLKPNTYTAVITVVDTLGSSQQVTVNLTVTPAAVVPRTVPHLLNGNGWTTSFLLVNADAQPQPYKLSFFADDGSPLPLPLGAAGTVASISGTIPAGGLQVVKTDGSAASLAQGWADLEAPDAVGGNVVFASQSSGQPALEASVPIGSTGSQRLLLPFDNTSGESAPYITTLTLANPGDQPANVSFTFLDDAGRNISGSGSIVVPAHGHYSKAFSAVLPALIGKRGVAQVSSNVKLYGLGLRFNNQAFAAIDALSSAPSGNRAISHMAYGEGADTTILLVNTDTQPAQFTLNFWNDSGAAVALPLGADGIISSVSGTIAPRGVRVIQTDASDSERKEGWADLETSGAIGGTAIVSEQPASGPASEAGIPVTSAAARQFLLPFDQSSSAVSFTLALVNYTSLDAAVSVSFTDEAGNTIPASGPAIVVPAYSQKAAALGNLFPQIVGKRGVVHISSTTEVYAAGLRYSGPRFTVVQPIALPDVQ